MLRLLTCTLQTITTDWILLWHRPMVFSALYTFRINNRCKGQRQPCSIYLTAAIMSQYVGSVQFKNIHFLKNKAFEDVFGLKNAYGL